MRIHSWYKNLEGLNAWPMQQGPVIVLSFARPFLLKLWLCSPPPAAVGVPDPYATWVAPCSSTHALLRCDGDTDVCAAQRNEMHFNEAKHATADRCTCLARYEMHLLRPAQQADFEMK